jgi:hypothetical protein
MNPPNRPRTCAQAEKEATSTTTNPSSKPVTHTKAAQEAKPAKSSDFTRFSDWPVEIRILIWKYACFQQRNINV